MQSEVKTRVEYEPYLQIWIATYGDIRSEGKTKEEALSQLEIDIAYSEYFPDLDTSLGQP